MKPYKRPEKEDDPAKYPGQIVNRPTHVGTLQQEISDFEALQGKLAPRLCAEDGQPCFCSRYCSESGRGLTNP